MKILVLLAIAIVCFAGITAAVLIAGGWYQNMLFDEYMEDIENPPKPRPGAENLPSIELMP